LIHKEFAEVARLHETPLVPLLLGEDFQGLLRSIEINRNMNPVHLGDEVHHLISDPLDSLQVEHGGEQVRNEVKVIVVAVVRAVLVHDVFVVLKVCDAVDVEGEAESVDGERGSAGDGALGEGAESFACFGGEGREEAVFFEMPCEAVDSHLEGWVRFFCWTDVVWFVVMIQRSCGSIVRFVR
jgi:hypothetical protein